MSRQFLTVLFFATALVSCARRDQVVPTACGAECGGCCDSNGQCLEGNSAQACGLDGIACMVCESGCFDGQCTGGSGGGAGGSGGAGGEGGAGGGGVPDAGEISTECPPDGWCIESPASDGTRVTQNILRGVFAISPNDVWAVGDQGTALHFDGQSWTNKSPANDDLFAVFAFGPNDVWAVGGSGWPTGPVGVAFHWDGTAWSEKLRGSQRLEAIWGASPNDVWAVGYGGEMQHWDGTKWTAAPKVTTEAITAIHGRSPNKLWAAGSTGLVMSFSANGWAVVPNNEFAGFAAIWAFSDTQVWAIGGNVSQAFDGTSWKPLDLGSTNIYLGFWGWAPGEGWGVGNDTLVRVSNATPLRKQVPTPELLLDVHGSDPHNIWAVGFKGTILRYKR